MKKIAILVMITVLLLVSVITSSGCSKKPAEFTINNLVLTPSEAQVRQEVTASVLVKNIGQLEGTYNVVLKINSAQIESKSITLAGGAEQTASFTFTRDVGPSCTIDVNGLTKSLTIQEGILPVLSVGDKWVSKWTTEGIEYSMSLEVTGEDFTDGKNCYVMEGTIDPPYQGFMDNVTVKYEKATMNIIRMQMSGEFQSVPFVASQTYSYDYPDKLPYPLEVGKEYTEITTTTMSMIVGGETQEEDTSTETTTYRIETIEEITVTAGTFRCFKINKYDELGNLTGTSWVSDKVKGYEVKSTDETSGDTYELISFVIH